jgi:hypothetical protein
MGKKGNAMTSNRQNVSDPTLENKIKHKKLNPGVANQRKRERENEKQKQIVPDLPFCA